MLFLQDWAGLAGLERAGVAGRRIGTEEVPGFLKSGVFGFGAVRGEEDFGLPSENARAGGAVGDGASKRRLQIPRL